MELVSPIFAQNQPTVNLVGTLTIPGIKGSAAGDTPSGDQPPPAFRTGTGVEALHRDVWLEYSMAR